MILNKSTSCRISISVATTWDCEPRFSPPQPSGHYALPNPYKGPLPENGQATIQTFRNRFPKLKSLVRSAEDAMRCAVYLAKRSSDQSATIHELVNHFSFQCYKLVVTQYEHSFIGEGLRLALLLFLIPIWRKVRFTGGQPPVLPTVEQLRKLKHVLEKLNRHNFDWTGLEHLRIFFVVMGYLEAYDEKDILWWTERWMEEMREWRNGDLVAQVQGETLNMAGDGTPLYSIFWVDSIHGERYRDISNRVKTTSPAKGNIRGGLK
jgi:hypothetical protein